MRRKRNRVFSSVLIAVGLVLILSALGLTAYNVWDMRRAEEITGQVTDDLLLMIPDTRNAPGSPETAVPAEKPGNGKAPPTREQDEEIPDYILAPDMEMPRSTVDGNDYIGLLEIPALGLRLPVASGWDYDLLKISPCRYTGSAYTEDLVIAGHNYKSHFGQLTSLPVDSKIMFTDVDGNVFQYAVTEFETLRADDIEGMTSGAPGLTLFTCTIGGQSRVALRARSCSTE